MLLYIDDSGSMRQGTRVADQIKFVQRAARISTLLLPEGYGTGLQFINDERQIDPKLNAERVEEIINASKPGGRTRIGTQLEQKILQPLVYDVINKGARLERPILIFCITDGCASGEPRTSFRDAIINCFKFLEEHNHPPYGKPLF